MNEDYEMRGKIVFRMCDLLGNREQCRYLREPKTYGFSSRTTGPLHRISNKRAFQSSHSHPRSWKKQALQYCGGLGDMDLAPASRSHTSVAVPGV